MSTRRVRPQAPDAAPQTESPAGGDAAAPQRPQRGRPAAAAAPQAAARPTRGRTAAPAATAGRADRRTSAAPSRATAAPAARIEPLVVFAPRSAAAKDPFFGPMASTMQDLYEVLHMEIAALDADEPEKLEILRHRKDGLANIYLESLVNLRRDESLKARLDDVDRAALHKAGDAVRAATVENMRRLQARIDTVTDVINSVIEAARTGGDDALKIYEPDGKVGTGQRATARLGLDTAL